eukprot:PITA_21689
MLAIIHALSKFRQYLVGNRFRVKTDKNSLRFFLEQKQLQERQQKWDNLHIVQNHQNLYANKGRVERQFEVGDLVFLRLQPYRQSSLKKKGDEKLKPRFYGSYQVTRRVEVVAYELELPLGSLVHNIFHVSCLKKTLGQQMTMTTKLPPMDDERHLVMEPETILNTRETHLWNRVIKEFLVRWKNLLDEDATWEGE